MYRTSQTFINAVRGSHTAVRYAEIVDEDDVLHTFSVIDGSASANSQDAIRRDATLTIVDETGVLSPTDINDLLMPFGSEFRLRAGVSVNGVEETVPWGVYRLDQVELVDGDNGREITINGYDRAFMVQQPSAKPVVIRAGTKYEEAIYKTIASRMTTVPDKSLIDTGYTTPPLFFKASLDLWEEASKMAKAVGCQVYFDANGLIAVSSVVAQMDASLVVSYSSDDSNVLSIARTIQADGLPNGVIVIGENSSLTAPVRGEAWDMNVRSPTYRYGRYGEVIKTETSEFVVTDAQAHASALGILEQELGPYETVVIETIPNPAHDIGDIIFVTREEIGVNGYYIITDITFPWSVTEPMSITARKKIVDD